MSLTRLIGMLYIVVGACGILTLMFFEPKTRVEFFNDIGVLLIGGGLFLVLTAVGLMMAVPQRRAEA